MKKISVKTKSALLFSLALLTFSAGIFALDFERVSAEQAPIEDALILPGSYEEYLPLQTPTDVAVAENYTAIADGNEVYVYDRKANEYSSYLHEENGNLTMDAVKKLQFGENGKLYFVDNSSGANFYELDVKTLTVTQKYDKIACATFTLSGDALYFTNSQGQLCYSSVTDETATPVPLIGDYELRKPTLAFWNNELYFTDNGALQILYKINPKSIERPTPVATPEAKIEYMSISAGVLTYTTSSGEFYAYSLNDVTETGLIAHETEDTHSTLSSFGEKTYVVAGDKIKCFSAVEKSFTDYEICSTSSSNHRLNGATDVAIAENQLYVADAGNARVSVLDIKSGKAQSSFALTLSPSFIATDGNTVLVSSESTAVIYLPTGEELFTASALKGAVVGATCAYGKYYLATADNYFYLLCLNEENTYTCTEIRKTSTRYPDLLTSDIYGNLYVKSGVYLYAFTEKEFIIPDAEGIEICDNLPAQAERLQIDYEKNVYALCESEIHKNGQPISFSVPLVYGEKTEVRAFAFSAEENQSYLLCDGNYLIQTARLALPTLKTIQVNSTDEEVFSNESAEFSVVETKENSLLIAFDLSTLKGETYFPYLSHVRSENRIRALKIGETDEYALLAVFDNEDKSYDTYLVLKENCSSFHDTEFSTVYAPSQQKKAYITNDVALYKFPYLTELLTVREVPRGGEVTLLGEITKLDHEYYHVAYGENTGYIPKSYLSEISASPVQTEEVIYGELQDNSDAIFRVIYIILGFAIVCILVDFLLLRKKGN